MAWGFDSPVVCPSFVGRDDQLSALHRTAAHVRSGSGQTLLVSGEAGIGKSRLAREFGAQLRRSGWVFLLGHSFEHDRLLPYAPILDALQMLQATLPRSGFERCTGPAAPDLARLLPELGAAGIESSVDPEQERRR